MVILSKAVGQEEQASVQAGLQLVQQLSGMWSNLAYTAWFFNVNAKRWAVVYYVFFTFGANCVAYGIGCATYWWCVYRPEMANAAKDQMYLFPVESSANPRRRVGAVRDARQLSRSALFLRHDANPRGEFGIDPVIQPVGDDERRFVLDQRVFADGRRHIVDDQPTCFLGVFTR